MGVPTKNGSGLKYTGLSPTMNSGLGPDPSLLGHCMPVNILFQQHYPRLCTFSRSSYQRISKCNMNLLIHLLLNELKPNKF